MVAKAKLSSGRFWEGRPAAGGQFLPVTVLK
jgi:hypothetical protein